MARLSLNKNVIYLVVAVGLGLLASFLAVQYINRQVAARTPVNHTETVAVVVANHAMQKGDIIKQDDISSRDVPATYVPADVVTPETYQNFIGQVLRAPLARGAPLSASAIDLVTDHFSNIINKGSVAYTIQVDDNNSTAGMMVPGDHVDILLMVTEGNGPRILPLQSDVLVLATGRRAEGVRSADSNAATEAYSSVTLELTPDQAQRVAVAAKAGELRLILRKAGNDEPFNLRELTKAELLRGPARRSTRVQFIIGGRG